MSSNWTLLGRISATSARAPRGAMTLVITAVLVAFAMQPLEARTLSPEFLSVESQEETWRALVQAARESGIDPALVYAMNKTGRIVTEQNMRFLTDADIQEWNEAVDE
jgi:hypothetical protein